MLFQNYQLNVLNWPNIWNLHPAGWRQLSLLSHLGGTRSPRSGSVPEPPDPETSCIWLRPFQHHHQGGAPHLHNHQHRLCQDLNHLGKTQGSICQRFHIICLDNTNDSASSIWDNIKDQSVKCSTSSAWDSTKNQSVKFQHNLPWTAPKILHHLFGTEPRINLPNIPHHLPGTASRYRCKGDFYSYDKETFINFWDE